MKAYITEKMEQEFPEEGLTPLAMKKLPAGAIHPSGWLERQMQIALQGLPGQLWKTGVFFAGNQRMVESGKDFYRFLEQYRPPLGRTGILFKDTGSSCHLYTG